MDKVLLLILAAAGLSAVSSRVKRQYHFVYEPKNMNEARSYCRKHYTDLASIDNMEDVENMRKVANMSKLNSLTWNLTWIGLYDDSWQWSRADSNDFRQWLDGQPDNASSEEQCVSMDEDGKWADNNCDDRFKPICIIHSSIGPDTTFVMYSTPMTWPEAQSLCRAHHTDLASVKNVTENQRVKSMVPAGQKVWIGLHRKPRKWLDGSKSSFRHWKDGRADGIGNAEPCATADFFDSGKWEDGSCTTPLAFVCYSPATVKEVIRLKLKTNPSVDMDNPAVAAEILVQFKQKLKDKGVDVDKVKLSWKKQPDGKIFSKQDKKQRKKRSTVRKKLEL